jgi:hypothetical protein
MGKAGWTAQALKTGMSSLQGSGVVWGKDLVRSCLGVKQSQGKDCLDQETIVEEYRRASSVSAAYLARGVP